MPPLHNMTWELPMSSIGAGGVVMHSPADVRTWLQSHIPFPQEDCNDQHVDRLAQWLFDHRYVTTKALDGLEHYLNTPWQMLPLLMDLRLEQERVQRLTEENAQLKRKFDELSEGAAVVASKLRELGEKEGFNTEIVLNLRKALSCDTLPANISLQAPTPPLSPKQSNVQSLEETKETNITPAPKDTVNPVDVPEAAAKIGVPLPIIARDEPREAAATAQDKKPAPNSGVGLGATLTSSGQTDKTQTKKRGTWGMWVAGKLGAAVGKQRANK